MQLRRTRNRKTSEFCNRADKQNQKGEIPENCLRSCYNGRSLSRSVRTGPHEGKGNNLMNNNKWDRDQITRFENGVLMETPPEHDNIAASDPDGYTSLRHVPSGYPQLLDPVSATKFAELDGIFLQKADEGFRDYRRAAALADEIQLDGLYPPAEQRWHVASYEVHVPSDELLARNRRFITQLEQLLRGENVLVAPTRGVPSNGAISRQLAIAHFNQATQFYSEGRAQEAVPHGMDALSYDDHSNPQQRTARVLAVMGMNGGSDEPSTDIEQSLRNELRTLRAKLTAHDYDRLIKAAQTQYPVLKDATHLEDRTR